jgi:hypothetical protein
MGVILSKAEIKNFEAAVLDIREPAVARFIIFLIMFLHFVKFSPMLFHNLKYISDYDLFISLI